MDELRHALNFSDDDLAANQEGNLSLRQRLTLQARQERSLQILMAMVIAIVLMLGISLVFGRMSFLIFGIMALVLAVMSLVEYVIGYQSYTRDLKSAQIETIQGVLHYVQRGESVMGIETHPAGIRVGDVQFLLLEHQARAFIEGEIYALHFAPATHTLLSAEPAFIDDAHIADDADIAYWDISHSPPEQSSD